MTQQEFVERLADLLAESASIPVEDIICEMEYALDGLRDDALNKEEGRS